MVNPSTNQVAQYLQQAAPHLLPEGYEAPKPGLVSRLLGG
jgi:hypothetical protein